MDIILLIQFCHFFTCQMHFMLAFKLFISFDTYPFQCQLGNTFDTSNKNWRNWVKNDYIHLFSKFKDQNIPKF